MVVRHEDGLQKPIRLVSPDRFNQRCDSVGYVFFMGKVIVTDALGALPDPLFMPLPQSQLLIAALSSQLSYTSKHSLWPNRPQYTLQKSQRLLQTKVSA